jgi:hypothetical protein
MSETAMVDRQVFSTEEVVGTADVLVLPWLRMLGTTHKGLIVVRCLSQ